MIEACGYAAEIVARGKARWDADVITRLAGEAVVGRIGDGAGKLPEGVREEIPGIEWDAIIRMRIVVHHVYHRIAYEQLWTALARDAPALGASLSRWRTGKR